MSLWAQQIIGEDTAGICILLLESCTYDVKTNHSIATKFHSLFSPSNLSSASVAFIN